MSMSGYTKLFNSILASTIWRAPDKTRIVWITMLAMVDKDGVVEGSVPGLADFARVSLEDCEAALLELSGPDQYSRSSEHEGRRIEAIDGVGWQLLNHGKYRAKMSEDERREYNRIKQAEWRANQKQSVKPMSTGVNDCQSQSAMSAHTEADTDTDIKTTIGQNKFDLFWDLYPRKVKKKTTLEIWKRKKLDEKAGLIIADIGNRIDNHRPWKDGYIPHPTAYLNGERWNDEIETGGQNGKSNNEKPGKLQRAIDVLSTNT